MTKLLKSAIESDILEAVTILKNGGIVALPTETVYGLAADASNEMAIKKIFKAKQRPENHPLILHIQSVYELENWAKIVSDDAITLAKHFWPGPITLLLPKLDSVSDIITGGSKNIAIRVSANQTFAKVLQSGKFSLVAPSANIHKKLSPTKAEHVMHHMNGLIDAVLDGGACNFGIESSIIDCTSSDIKILRLGPIQKKEIEDVLKKTVQDVSFSETSGVSGSMLQHYQPNKKTYVLESALIQKFILKNTNCIVLYYSDEVKGILDNARKIQMPNNPKDYAILLYSSLYDADRSDAGFILVEKPPESEQWSAVNDRLKKASV